MTPEAMASPIIRKEWRYARQKGVCVYPVKGVPDEELDYIMGIVFQGASFRVDEIRFHDDMRFLENHPPELWRIGPQFASIFTPFTYLLSARDPDGDFLDFIATIGGYGANGKGPTNFVYRLPIDPNDPNTTIAPDVAVLYFVPQTFDDLVITIQVTDGMLSDVETFTLSVVNYPVSESEEVQNMIGHVLCVLPAHIVFLVGINNSLR